MHRAAGVDVSYRGNRYFAALAAFADGSPQEFHTETGFSPEPYRSKLFFLKEAPIISRLVYGQDIDLLFVNGHGICHPYHFGLATVVGITHKVATIGVARRLVKGEYDWRASRCEGVRFIVQSGRPIGAAVRRRPGDSPIFISPGYGIRCGRRSLSIFHLGQRRQGAGAAPARPSGSAKAHEGSAPMTPLPPACRNQLVEKPPQLF